jgi:hypothetical protein
MESKNRGLKVYDWVVSTEDNTLLRVNDFLEEEYVSLNNIFGEHFKEYFKVSINEVKKWIPAPKSVCWFRNKISETQYGFPVLGVFDNFVSDDRFRAGTSVYDYCEPFNENIPPDKILSQGAVNVKKNDFIRHRNNIYEVQEVEIRNCSSPKEKVTIYIKDG